MELLADPNVWIAFLMLSALEIVLGGDNIIVFSLDSVITAVGMVDHISVMVAAVIFSVLVMLVAAKPIGEFVDPHPSVKVLALAFLVMVGMALTAEAFEADIPKGYIYAAMAFSLAVEGLNIRARAKRKALPPRI